jgi:predicted phosphate transport protein (TIGR00153 family)
VPYSRFITKMRYLLGGEGTTLDGVIDAMGKEREEQVLQRTGQFIDQVVVIVEKLENVVELFASDRYEELEKAASELDELESRADDVKEDILDQLCLGGVFPMHRADLARLVASMDSIANLATGAADRISMRRFTLPKETNEQLVALVKVDVEAVRALREAVIAMGIDLREAIKVAGSVDKLESRADKIYASLYRGMFDLDIDFKVFQQLKSILDRLESIADRCAENAERLRHMALGYLERD